jgi:heptaprenyl diphosphate synthase
MKSIKLHDALRIDLEDIDLTLRTVVESDPDLPHPSVIRDQVLRLINAGGKRLRPIMVLVGSRFGDTNRMDPVMRTAAVLEYLHTSSLIHDDVIDRSKLRRGAQTLHEATDISTAVLIANYMMTRALEWASSSPIVHDEDEVVKEVDEETRKLAQLASLATELCLGEYGQLDNRFNFDLKLEDYLEKTKNKTAMLMAFCLQAGGIAANADIQTTQLLYRYGEALGMAFQIQDDVLDFTKPAADIGKPSGADLRNGIITLPVLYALTNPELEHPIRSLHAGSSELEFDEVINLINNSGAIELALDYARDYTTQALEMIHSLSNHEAYRDLQILLNFFRH